MAEGFLKSFDPELEVFSAGTDPSSNVNPGAVNVMMEIGIDISKNHTKNVDRFLNELFDYVITVCDNAKETCPVFMGKVAKRIHIGFEDPAEAVGSEEDIHAEFSIVRDKIKKEFFEFYKKVLAL